MKQYLFLVFVFFSFYGISQNIPNSDFENWTNGNPDGWQTLNSFSQQFGVITVTQESANPYSGSYSVKLETKNFVGSAVPGLITNGQISINFNTPTPITILGGSAFTGRPNHFKGYFRYQATGDYCTIVALLLKKNTQTNQFDTVGVAQFINNATVNNWTLFDAPFVYTMNETPDTVQIMAVSSNPNAAAGVGSVLWVDHFYFEGGSLGSYSLKLNESVQIYPNAANDILNIYFGKATTGQTTVTLFNTTGQRVKEMSIPSGTQITSLNIYDLRKGLYIIQIQSANGRFVQKISVK